MSNVPIQDANSAPRKIDTFQRTEGADTVEIQAIAVVNPATGDALAPTVAGAMPVVGTFWQATQPVSFIWAGLTDAQLRATALPVSGTFWQTTQPVSFTWAGLTDAELRAAPVPVSAASLPLPAGAATEATLATLAGAVSNHDAVAADGHAGVVMLAKRRDSDATAMVQDGDFGFISLDENQRVKVSTQPASYVPATGNITANAQTVFLNVERASNVTISMVATTLVGHNATFEFSNNSTNGTDGNWYVVQVARTNANTAETATGVLAATPAYGWEVSVNAYKWIRVRATAHTSGTAAYAIVPGSYATEPVPVIQVTGTQPVSGSVTATLAAAATRVGFVAGAGIWYDDSAVALASNATFTGTSRDATVTATATAFANAATYAMEVRISAESDQSGTLWLETSRDNTNWRRVKSVATAAVTGGGQFAEIVHRPSWRYWRAGFTNGATLQARFSIGSIAIAA
jgi:hypothetical protein